MNIEIERKFLVDRPSMVFITQNCETWSSIIQGYIKCESKFTSVRVRLIHNNFTSFITIKNSVDGTEFIRAEYEYPIPYKDAESLLDGCCKNSKVEKVRYTIFHDGLKWEVDLFSGSNDELITAEIELKDPNQEISLPHWLGKEITHDKRYLNSELAENPYCNWK